MYEDNGEVVVQCKLMDLSELSVVVAISTLGLPGNAADLLQRVDDDHTDVGVVRLDQLLYLRQQTLGENRRFLDEEEVVLYNSAVRHLAGTLLESVVAVLEREVDHAVLVGLYPHELRTSGYGDGHVQTHPRLAELRR